MLKQNERLKLESNLISAVISSERRFRELYISRFNTEHLFTNKSLRELYSAIVKYFEKNNELPTIHFQLRDFGDFKSVWENYKIGFTTDTYFDVEKILVDDYLESKTIEMQREIKNLGYKGP